MTDTAASIKDRKGLNVLHRFPFMLVAGHACSVALTAAQLSAVLQATCFQKSIFDFKYCHRITMYEVCNNNTVSRSEEQAGPLGNPLEPGEMLEKKGRLAVRLTSPSVLAM